MRLRHFLLMGLACTATALLGTSQGLAHELNVTVTNNSGAAKDSLHITFIGTGGTITDAAILTNGGPGNATISVQSGADVGIKWDDGGLGDGKTVSFRFKCDFLPEPDAYWYPGGDPVPEEDISLIEKVPSLTQWGLIILLGVLLLSGIIVIRQRRRAVRV